MLRCSIIGRVFLLWIAVAWLVQPSSATACLSYDPSAVRITGVLVRETFPGPPGYESVRRGDQPETYWFLNVSPPLCLNEDKTEPDLNPALKDIRRIQLVFLDQTLYMKYKGLVGKRTVATGTLFGAHTGHHHAPVLLTVAGLELPHGK